MWTRTEFLMTLFPLLALADDLPMTKLRIEVRTRSDKPVERASVIVRFLEDRPLGKLHRKVRTHWELRTNQDGVASIPPIPQGKIMVQVIAKGYQTFGQNFDVSEEEKTLLITLNPPQPQYSAH
jgi:hypothetical protein